MERSSQPPENPKSPTTLASRIHALREEERGLERELRDLALAFIAKALNAVREVPGFAPQPEVNSEDFIPVVAKTRVLKDMLEIYLARRDGGEHYHEDGSTIQKLWGLMKLVSKPDGNETDYQPIFRGMKGSHIAGQCEYVVTIDIAALENGEPEILAGPSAAAPDAPPPAPAVETEAAARQVIAGGISWDTGPKTTPIAM